MTAIEPEQLGGAPPLWTTSTPCEVHREHTPRPHVNHVHHVWPRGQGGPDVPENKVVICPSGHYNTHRLLDELIACRGEVRYAVLKQFAKGERELAQTGYDRIIRQAL